MTEYDLVDCVVTLEAPVEVGRAPGHHWFCA